ncbi:transmembrane [Olea europaea subsp. europaea]|uniref:Transmembrane n=1 Tax=Olea europaea subsp. europaea TaxID=158383 RepID=A0A8S0QAA6_OLEEU|nr:transmembrane [Olea europaea subsp. europaea]
MSARSDLAVGAQLKLCSRVSSAVICMRQYFCGALQHSLYLFFPTVSMRLRLKRTCSGVECFGGFHINRLSNFFLFIRGPIFLKQFT